MQGVCERNMLSALKKFNNNINDGNKLTLKPKLNELHKQLTPAGNNADEEFKKSYNSIKDLIGACAEKCPGKFNISSD